MTDQEKIAKQFGLSVEQLNATSPYEKHRAIAESLSSDERSLAAMFKMSEADIAEMVSDRADEFTPAEAVARLNALGKTGQGRLLAVNAAAGHRLYALAAQADTSFCSLRDATADLVRASGGKVHALRSAVGGQRLGSSLDTARLSVLSLDVIALSAGGKPPTSFRIFRAGANETTKGVFLFSAASRLSVMDAATKHGADLPIDYEHKMLDPNASIGDMIAAGKFKLGIRGGELWAENVRWTPKADAHLRAGEWSYISPAFISDESGQVRSVINVALTNLPATHQLDALVAASRRVA